jgi:LacI family trehalose operon transcriptional repressor
MQNRLTIKDIARLSGVGKSTVSRVLNNESGVSERTRERVEAVMNQHGFSPSRSARAMRGQSDKVVAIIVTRLDFRKISPCRPCCPPFMNRVTIHDGKPVLTRTG